jgi:hypothetical protein
MTRTPEKEDEAGLEIVLEAVLKHVSDQQERRLALHWLSRAERALRQMRARRISGA